MSAARIPGDTPRRFLQLLRGFTTDRFMALAADSAAVVLLTAGFAHLFFTLAQLAVPLSSVLWMSIACTAAVVLLSRRWWILPLLLLAGLVAAGIVLWRSDDPAALMKDVVVKAQMAWWILTGYTAPDKAVVPVLAWICVCVLNLPLFLIVRRLFNIVVITLSSAALYLYLWFAGLSPSIVAMALCIAGVAMLFPRGFAAGVNRRAGAEPLARGAMQALAVPVCLLCMLLALAFVPNNTSTWRLRILVNGVADVKDLLDLWEGDVRPYSDFTIASVGFQPLGRLGGPIVPSAREYLRIRSDDGSLYLRGSTRDVYSGHDWSDSRQDERFRFGSLLWRGTQNEVFDTGRPAGKTRSAFLRDVTTETEYTLTHMIDGMPYFFVGSRPERLRLTRNYGAIPYFNRQGEIYTYETIPTHNGYFVRTRFFDTTEPGYDEKMLSWENRAVPDPEEWIEAIRLRYLQLPADLPASVAETARAAAGEGTPYQRASRLLAFFKEGFTYTLSPVVPPADMDFVAHFLDTREGYCVYFATAMTVMARTQGLPARYVEGFISPAAGSGNMYSISGKLAHAWVEIYFDGLGWIPFDPTVGRDPAAPVVTPSVTVPIEDPTITPEPTTIPVTPTIPPPPEDGFGAPVLLIVVAAILLLTPPAFWITVRIRRGRLVSRYRLSSVRRRFVNRERQMSFYHRDMLRQLACLDIRPEPGETLTEFGRRADRRLGFASASVEDATDVVLRRRYGLLFPSGEDIEAQSRIHRALELHLQAVLTPGQYIRKRVFGLQGVPVLPGSDID